MISISVLFAVTGRSYLGNVPCGVCLNCPTLSKAVSRVEKLESVSNCHPKSQDCVSDIQSRAHALQSLLIDQRANFEAAQSLQAFHCHCIRLPTDVPTQQLLKFLVEAGWRQEQALEKFRAVRPFLDSKCKDTKILYLPSMATTRNS
jgi:hypothetical protein